jgi:hypothetical protein
VATAVIAVAGWFGFWRYHLKRFDAVQAGVLYRGAQPTELGFQHVVARHNVRTVVSVRLEDPALYRGLVDLGDPDGEQESRYVPQLGPRHLHWPMDDEAYWPWFTPWMFEDFFTLMDDPANWPVLVHCLGGRHRTGTFSAMFQLEYNRRPVEDVLREMYSFDFGEPAPIQEHNLRTYLPRPLPVAAQWTVLVDGLAAKGTVPRAFRELVRQLRAEDEPARVAQYIKDNRPFAVCLAHWLIDRPDHPLTTAATHLAARLLEESEDPAALASAASLVADFGSPAQQERLLSLLQAQSQTSAPSPRYEAIVAGLTNRYTPNRIAFLAPLVGDRRQRVDPRLSRYRYCDTAAVRLTSIVNEQLHPGTADPGSWDMALANCQRWLAEHPDRCQLSTLLPPLSHVRPRASVAPEVDGRQPMR